MFEVTVGFGNVLGKLWDAFKFCVNGNDAVKETRCARSVVDRSVDGCVVK